MTAQELITHLNKTYGFSKWPSTYTVDAITYANCCQFIFNNVIESGEYAQMSNIRHMTVFVGVTKNGLMFKNIELILKHD